MNLNFRNRIGFAILGLTNNFAYVVMLSAANDLLKDHTTKALQISPDSSTTSSPDLSVTPFGTNGTTKPYCNPHSTATILLADTIPSLSIKFIFPFLLVGLPFSYKAIATALLAAAAFTITGLSSELVLIFAGVICASLSSGVGEATYLSSTPRYGDVALSGWSIGTGAAGLVGSGAYAILTEFFKIQTIMIVMLVVPVAMLASFYLIIKATDLKNTHEPCATSRSNSPVDSAHSRATSDVECEVASSLSSPQRKLNYQNQEHLPIDKQKARLYGSDAGRIFEQDKQSNQLAAPNVSHLSNANSAVAIVHQPLAVDNDQFGSQNDSTEMTFKQKLNYVPKLSKYFLPLTLVYFAEYFINQGLFELIYFKEVGLDKDAQYRWFQVSYQLGVLISRSSIECFRIKNIWTMSVLQLINAVIFLGHTAKFYHLQNFFFVVGLIVYEGLLGGFTYVNTFHRIKREIEPSKQAFCISLVTIADSVGIVLAGFSALPVHQYLCKFYDDIPISN